MNATHIRQRISIIGAGFAALTTERPPKTAAYTGSPIGR